MKSILFQSAPILGAIAWMAVCPASAVEFQRAVLLPDDGYGSEVHGGLARVAEVETAIPAFTAVGRKTDANGRAVPCMWHLNGDGLFTSSEVLSLLPYIEQSAIVGGHQFLNGDLVVLGWTDHNESDPGISLRRHAFLARKPAGGAWQAPEFLSQDASDAVILAAKGGGEVAIEELVLAVGSATIDGLTRPALYRVGPATAERILLPVPVGGMGEALGLYSANIGQGIVCGWVASRSRGRVSERQPVVWFSTDSGWKMVPLPFPLRVAGAATDLSIRLDQSRAGISSVTEVIGELTTSGGRTLGWYVPEFDSTGSQMRQGHARLLPPLPGFGNARTLAFGSGDDEAIFGLSWNDVSDAVATVWFPQIVSPRDLQTGQATSQRVALPARQWLTNPSAVSRIRSLRSSTARYANQEVSYLIGQVNPLPGAPAQAALFHRARIAAPDALAVRRGFNSGSLPLADAIKVWHDDDAALVRGTENRGSLRRIVVEAAINGLLEWDPYSLEIVARAQSGSPDARGTLKVSIYDEGDTATHEAGHWVGLGSFALNDADQTITIELQAPGSQWLDPVNGRVRLMLEFIAGGNGRSSALVLGRINAFDRSTIPLGN